MEPITVAVVGDDPNALRIMAKLQENDPGKIIIVGAVPHHYSRPFFTDTFDLYPPIQKLVVNKEPDIPFVSDKLAKLLRRAGVVVKSSSNDDSPQRG